MKRLAIVLVVVTGIVAVCAYSLYKVGELRDGVGSYVGAVFTAVERRDRDAAVSGAYALTDYWNGKRTALVRYVRHAQVDEVTRSVSRLVPLADLEAYAELAAELACIRWQIDHIWESEQITPGNIL